jgi:hypothetical protein
MRAEGIVRQPNCALLKTRSVQVTIENFLWADNTGLPAPADTGFWMCVPRTSRMTNWTTPPVVLYFNAPLDDLRR